MIGRAEALDMLKAHVESINLVHHCVAAGIIMESLARHFDMTEEDVNRWELAGLLHDLDYGQTADDPAQHGVISARLLADQLDEEQLHAILAHAGHAPLESVMDHALYAADPTTGFIVAAALVRPDKSLDGVELKSLRKRWKEKSFARGASREQMATCEDIGLERDAFLELALAAMKARADEIGLAAK